MTDLLHLIQPGGHVVLHLHHTGPEGGNGTQQFPKLTDCELCSLLKPMIEESILCVYAMKPTEALGAQNLMANLHPIVKIALTIFARIERQHGYCSCECVGAMHRVQEAHGGLSHPIFLALMVCLSFADLTIRLSKAKKTDKRGEPTAIDPTHPIFHAHAPRPSPTAPHPTAPDLDTAALKELYRQTVERSAELRRLIVRAMGGD